MNRRQFVQASAALASVACATQETSTSVEYNLRYAPRIGFLNDLPVQRQLEIYAEHGFRAFEYNGLPRHSLQEAQQFRRKMDQLGMEMGVFVVNSGGWKGDALVDTAFHEGFLKDVHKALEYHGIMRNGWSTVTSGLAVSNIPLDQQTKNVIEGLKRAADIVSKTDLVLVLEPLNVLVNHAGYFVVTSEHAAEIIDAVGSPQVKILFDIYHQQISEGNLIDNIEKYWERIAYFQVGDVPGRKEPGTGEINYRNVFKAIHAKGYTGLLGMEHGLSQPGMSGLEKCFREYKQADTWT